MAGPAPPRGCVSVLRVTRAGRARSGKQLIVFFSTKSFSTVLHFRWVSALHRVSTEENVFRKTPVNVVLASMEPHVSLARRGCDMNLNFDPENVKKKLELTRECVDVRFMLPPPPVRGALSQWRRVSGGEQVPVCPRLLG